MEKESGPLTEPMFYTLMAFHRNEMCGMEAADFIAQKTGGRVRIGPGTLYSMLSRFVERGILEETLVEGRKRTYRITQKGISLYSGEVTRLRRCVRDAEAESVR